MVRRHLQGGGGTLVVVAYATSYEPQHSQAQLEQAQQLEPQLEASIEQITSRTICLLPHCQPHYLFPHSQITNLFTKIYPPLPRILGSETAYYILCINNAKLNCHVYFCIEINKHYIRRQFTSRKYYTLRNIEY